jgi:hypothetical protein
VLIPARRAAGIVFAPVVRRLLHRFHVETDGT